MRSVLVLLLLLPLFGCGAPIGLDAVTLSTPEFKLQDYPSDGEVGASLVVDFFTSGEACRQIRSLDDSTLEGVPADRTGGGGPIKRSILDGKDCKHELFLLGTLS